MGMTAEAGQSFRDCKLVSKCMVRTAGSKHLGSFTMKDWWWEREKGHKGHVCMFRPLFIFYLFVYFMLVPVLTNLHFGTWRREDGSGRNVTLAWWLTVGSKDLNFARWKSDDYCYLVTTNLKRKTATAGKLTACQLGLWCWGQWRQMQC